MALTESDFDQASFPAFGMPNLEDSQFEETYLQNITR